MSTWLAGFVLTPEGLVDGGLDIRQGRIDAVKGRLMAAPALPLRPGDPLILPGFIDAHVHGGGGRDVMEGGDAIDGIAHLHARHGTTALLATTVTAPAAELHQAFAALGPACRRRTPGCARVLGAHLEGPFISASKLGAQPPFASIGTFEQVQLLHALAPIRVITLAPEVPGHLALVEQLAGAGFLVQIGHSEASYEDSVAALNRGAASFTHLFNAMSGLHHRAPGVVGAALAHARYAEVIPDGVHVHPGALHAALRAIPGLYGVTDATTASGMPDGTYRLGAQAVSKCSAGVRLADGTLAGSALTMDQAFRNLLAMGLDLQRASRCLSMHVADFLRIADRGRIQGGMRADLVVMDGASLAVRQVVVEGEAVIAASAVS
jgi:N-acetylglucosamine-6-phosphate deacetylase